MFLLSENCFSTFFTVWFVRSKRTFDLGEILPNFSPGTMVISRCQRFFLNQNFPPSDCFPSGSDDNGTQLYFQDRQLPMSATTPPAVSFYFSIGMFFSPHSPPLSGSLFKFPRRPIQASETLRLNLLNRKSSSDSLSFTGFLSTHLSLSPQ